MPSALATRPARPVLAVLRDRAVRLAEMVATPLVPADYLDLMDPLRASAELRGRIISVTPETKDAATVVLEPGRAWRGHTPGQYVRVGVDVGGVRLWRAYSLTGATEREDGCIAITVKAIPDGVVSNHLVRDARPGTLVQLDQAQGDFTLADTAPAKTLFVTAGSGITPVMGMLRNRSADLEDVVVVHSAPTADDVIFGAELRTLHADGRIRLVQLHTDRDGMLDTERLTAIVPDLADREAWACGPAGLLDALEQHFADAGILGQLHTERFRATVVTPGEGGSVTFSGSATTVQADGETTLLDAGEAAGVLMPSGCRMGICFGCVVPLREGAVRDLRTGEITTAAPGDGIRIQTCISGAAGACDIDL